MEPYKCKHKVAIFGGHFDFVKKIKIYLPNVKIYQFKLNPSNSIIDNIDIIFIQNRACCHAMFCSLVNKVRKNKKIKFYYFSQSSAKKCAEEVIQRDLELSD